MASIETNLLTQTDPSTGQPWPGNAYCESGKPTPIEVAVADAAPLVPVNLAPLCASNADAKVLTQSPTINGDVNITVTCVAGCASPTSTSVSLDYNAKGIVAPFGLTYNMMATS